MMAIVVVAGLLIGGLLNWASDVVPGVSGSGAGLPCEVWPSWSGWTVEALCVGIAVGIWLEYGPSVSLALECSFFLLIALIDLKYRLVPNLLVYPAIAASLILSLAAAPERLPGTLLGGGLAFGVFSLTRLVRPGTLGGGDVKLALLLGLMFGFPQVLWVLLVGGIAGGLAAGYLLLARQSGAQTTIPYAPFLSLGALVAAFYDPMSHGMGR